MNPSLPWFWTLSNKMPFHLYDLYKVVPYYHIAFTLCFYHVFWSHGSIQFWKQDYTSGWKFGWSFPLTGPSWTDVPCTVQLHATSESAEEYVGEATLHFTYWQAEHFWPKMRWSQSKELSELSTRILTKFYNRSRKRTEHSTLLRFPGSYATGMNSLYDGLVFNTCGVRV